MKLRGLVVKIALGVVAVGLFAAAPASAATVFNLDLHHGQTNFAPGEKAQYWVELDNVGDTESSGTITLKVTLPKGMTRDGVFSTGNFPSFPQTEWSCPGSVGKPPSPAPVSNRSKVTLATTA